MRQFRSMASFRPFLTGRRVLRRWTKASPIYVLAMPDYEDLATQELNQRMRERMRTERSKDAQR